MIRRWLWLCAIAACGRVGFGDHAVGDAASADAPRSIDAPIRPPVFVQHVAMASETSTVSATFDAPVTVGDLIVIGFDYDVPSLPLPDPSSLVDSQGDPYTLVGPFDGTLDDMTQERQYIAYAFAQATATTTVTLALSDDTISYVELRLHEYARVSATDPFDGAAGSAGASADTIDSAQSAAITTSQPNELIFGMVIDGTVAAGTGFTLRGNDFEDVTEDMIATTPGTYRATATPTNAWVATVAAFRGD